MIVSHIEYSEMANCFDPCKTAHSVQYGSIFFIDAFSPFSQRIAHINQSIESAGVAYVKGAKIRNK